VRAEAATQPYHDRATQPRKAGNLDDKMASPASLGGLQPTECHANVASWLIASSYNGGLKPTLSFVRPRRRGRAVHGAGFGSAATFMERRADVALFTATEATAG
jgi:hypothetical protein